MRAASDVRCQTFIRFLHYCLKGVLLQPLPPPSPLNNGSPDFRRGFTRIRHLFRQQGLLNADCAACRVMRGVTKQKTLMADVSAFTEAWLLGKHAGNLLGHAVGMCGITRRDVRYRNNVRKRLCLLSRKIERKA